MWGVGWPLFLLGLQGPPSFLDGGNQAGELAKLGCQGLLSVLGCVGHVPAMGWGPGLRTFPGAVGTGLI